LAKQKKKEAAKVVVEKEQMEKDRATKEEVEKERQKTEIDGKSASHHSNEQELSEQGGGGGEEQSTPFILKRRGQENTIGHHKKNKLDKQTHLEPMVLTEGGLDEIGDKVRDTTTEVLQQFE